MQGVEGDGGEVLQLVELEGYLVGGETRDEERQPYLRHAYNVKVSNRVPVNRSLPDTRPPEYVFPRVYVCVCVSYLSMLPIGFVTVVHLSPLFSLYCAFSSDTSNAQKSSFTYSLCP